MSEEKPMYLTPGDPYPEELEELDPERYRVNQLAHAGMDALGRWLSQRGQIDNGEWVERWREMLEAHEEYEKARRLVSEDG